MKKKIATIRSERCAACACPNCSHELSGVTAARVGESIRTGPLRLKGKPTMCGYCGALLIFADNAGRVRMMTEAERNVLQLHPEAKKLMDSWKRDHVPAPDFTKKRFN
jgi:hypothetical protein